MSVLFAEVFGPDAEEGEADEGNREDVEEPHDAERGPEVREEERDEQDERGHRRQQVGAREVDALEGNRRKAP